MTHCLLETTPPTHQRGRVSTKVRYGPVQLVLDVPDGDVLLAWAANPHQQQVVRVVFFDAAGGQPVETLRLPGAYCISYHEQFSSRDVSGGAYQCTLTLSDPTGWTIQAGGPARAYVAPAARSYAGAGAVATNFLERETDSEEAMAFDAPARFAALVEPSEGLAAVLASCLTIKQPQVFDPEIDPNLFRNQVIRDLEKIYDTDTGKAMLESLAKSGKKVSIIHTMSGNAIGGYTEKEARYLQADGKAGAGTNSVIRYYPSIVSLGKEDEWDVRPPAIGLAHELIHAEQAAYGRMIDGKAPNGSALKLAGSKAKEEADIRELEAVGVPPYDTYPFSENKIRAQWKPVQPERKWY